MESIDGSLATNTRAMYSCLSHRHGSTLE